MRDDLMKAGNEELVATRRKSRGLYWAVGLFSLFANLLMLTGPMYMLQVYDRVLGSGSEETLIALTVLVIFLYFVMGILDFTRGRVMARVGAQFQQDLDKRVFNAIVRKSAVAPDVKTSGGLHDLEAVQRLITAPVLMAAFDLPWTPIFFAAIFVFHPLLGWLAVGGAALLILIAYFNQLLSHKSQRRAGQHSLAATSISDQITSEAEMVQAMGMRGAAFERWQKARSEALDQQIQTMDVSGGFASVTKSLRLFLQSAMLGVGAWLVLQNQLTAGAMIAGSILLGRALAPVELALNQWGLVQRGREGWQNLAVLLGAVPPESPRTELPVPKAHLVAKGLTVVPPGEKQAALKSVNFELKPGQALGVIGPSGAGKSTLARTLMGLWHPAGGTIRLDGAALDHYGTETLGRLIGYLPQRVQLFDGTVAENIARLSGSPDAAKVVEAAKAAAAHEMILQLSQGYDTRITAGQSRLSGGEMQRIGLARALYNDPVIVVLDEPNSNLDNTGSVALNHAIRAMKARGRSVMIMAHRPAAIQECDTLLVLDNGMRMAFGPKDEVLKGMVANAEQIQKSPVDAGGVT